MTEINLLKYRREVVALQPDGPPKAAVLISIDYRIAELLARRAK